jgi:hypothetical protein
MFRTLPFPLAIQIAPDMGGADDVTLFGSTHAFAHVLGWQDKVAVGTNIHPVISRVDVGVAYLKAHACNRVGNPEGLAIHVACDIGTARHSDWSNEQPQ